MRWRYSSRGGIEWILKVGHCSFHLGNHWGYFYSSFTKWKKDKMDTGINESRHSKVAYSFNKNFSKGIVENKKVNWGKY